MSVHDTWKIAMVLPEDFQDFDDWALQTPDLDVNGITGGIIYHKHTGEDNRGAFQSVLYMTRDGKCRKCGASAPPGIQFLSRVTKLVALGDTDAANH